MSTQYLRLILLGLLVGLMGVADAQPFEAAMNKLSAAHSPEKIYIQYDKEYYLAGETAWFKAYLYTNGKPSGISNNFYLQLKNSKGDVIVSQKLPVIGATVKGSISFPDSLPQGNYYIKAFTPFMMNGDDAFMYHKNIFLFRQGGVSSAASTTKTISLHFFPESGYLIDGILSVVAFKATDQWGTPEEVNGMIKTEDGATIASFKSFHDGIGRVQFKPIAGKKYIAEVETEAGKRIYPLPEVQTAGINLKISDEPGGKKFQLSRGGKIKEEFNLVRLVVTINYNLIYENEIAFEDYPSVIGHIVTDSLPSGILHFTVFDKENKPIAERLAFTDNGEYRSIGEIKLTKKGLGKREENNFEISFNDITQHSLSVSVVDAAFSQTDDKDNIWSRFLLTADLKGYVYNPSWYFEKKTDSTRLGLDNLMLTHGWSRYSWTKLLAGQYPEIKYTDEPLINIRGLVTDKANKPVNGGRINIFLEAADSLSIPYNTAVDENGRFLLDSLVYRGKGEFYYAYTDKQEKPREAIIIPDENKMETEMLRFIPVNTEIAGMKSDRVVISKDELRMRIQQLKDVSAENIKELENVQVSATNTGKKAADAINDKYTSGVFRSPGKETIDNITEPPTDKFQNGVDFVKNRIQQLVLDGNRFTNRKNFSLLTGQRWTVGLFIDEQPADLLQLRLLRADEIALVKFYEAGFVGTSSSTPGGALAVYTKEKKREAPKDDKLESFIYPGYTVTKEYYNPDYSVPVKKQFSDNRSTLFWAPDLFTNAEEKTIPIRFFNNDVSKKYKIITEGFDANGKLVRLEMVVE